jgi:hypothetical protein
LMAFRSIMGMKARIPKQIEIWKGDVYH